ncbi:MAG: UDP-2,3-diacylglucosamine diphosphatase LpxI [Alphaproteobacteria bacterium]|nr:UDP-2,3-diacylglucosamine diphosphatase LpxI [Alphaproteobacteria bacterium]MDX5370308.1 UDP-2,3-diacylglucosamine diphosphatase LpxI [Alphaproteobacteria bacterium]MDX5464844.1 UDP-2,3-diacylglucosamine diphosphatase LpxI [Alphaproteobacteria bacterium]
MSGQGPLGIVAGGGALPGRLAAAARAAGRAVYVVALEGEGAEIGADASVGLGQVGRLFALLRKAGCHEVAVAGYVSRPDLRALKLDWAGMRLLPRLAPKLRGGDDALMRTIVAAFEEAGFRVIGAEEVAAPLLAPDACLTVSTPSGADWADIARADAIVTALAPLDVGQGAVVARGIVLAIETVEGTDAMLARLADLPAHVRGTGEAARAGVLLKAAKHAQERRLDLPAIGPETVRRAAAAGLAGIAVRAGDALILDREALVAAANAAGLFVIGYTAQDLSRHCGEGA